MVIQGKQLNMENPGVDSTSISVKQNKIKKGVPLRAEKTFKRRVRARLHSFEF